MPNKPTKYDNLQLDKCSLGTGGAAKILQDPQGQELLACLAYEYCIYKTCALT